MVMTCGQLSARVTMVKASLEALQRKESNPDLFAQPPVGAADAVSINEACGSGTVNIESHAWAPCTQY